MRTKIIFLTILLFVCSRLSGQNRIIYGRVISEELEPVGGAKIKADTLVVGNTDVEGRFKMSVPKETMTISFSLIGMETAKVNLNRDCDTVEFVMMDSYIYDFVSLRKVNSLRLKRFKKLPKLHLEAYKKGLFLKNMLCYTMEFKPVIGNQSLGGE